MQFPHEGGFGGFSRFHFAAWELPKTCHGFALRALGEKDATIGIDQCYGGDEKRLHER